MTKQTPPIYFYIPESYWPNTLPKHANDDWKGFGIGIYCWTIQTYLHLKEHDFPCFLTKDWPDEGIVLVHRDSFQAFQQYIKPGAKVLLICMKAEWERYPYAQIQVVQNPREETLWRTNYYIPLWPQAALVPRDPDRGDCFKNIAFLGNPENLAPELKTESWQQQLKDIGLCWKPILDRACWNDYREIDATLAVRSFNKKMLYTKENFITKPATKLYNSWRAGVPALLGCEAAFQAERKSELDYLEVTSAEDTLNTLKMLKERPDLRQSMVEQGNLRAEEFKPEKVLERWEGFLTDVAVPAYENWCDKSSLEQDMFLKRQYFIFKIGRAKSKLRNLSSRFISD